MSNFIYQIEKKELEEHIEIIFYIADKENKTKIEKVEVPYSILAKKEDFEILNIKSDNIILSNQIFINKNGENVVEIQIMNKELYEYVKEQLKEKEFSRYEADLVEESRILINKQIPIQFADNLTIENSSKSSDLTSMPNLKYICLDIETIGDIDNLEIIMLSTYSPFDKNMSKVYVNLDKLPKKYQDINKIEKFEDFETIYIKDEKELLEKFKEDLIKFEPQIITGWNVIDFDFKVIRDRFRAHSIEFKLSKYDGDNKLRINKDFFQDSTLLIPGVLVFDCIQLLKSNFIIFDDYKLNTVAKEVLGDTKIDIQEEDESGFDDKVQEITNLLKTNLRKLIEYNFKDSLLVSQIIGKLSLLELMYARSIVTETPLLRVKSPIATLDIMYLKKLHQRGIVAESNFNFSQSGQIEGAFVFEPTQGFYEDIFVLDFKSLYPSIIMTFNIDPYTYSDKGEIEAPNGAKFTSKLGILPELILTLYKERDEAKKTKDDIKSYALKTTMNSFYGAMASPKSRFHNREVGGAITAFGRFIIQKAIKFVEDIGHKVIYSDTDSIFVKIKDLEGKSLDNKKKLGFELEEELNLYFKGWVESEFKQKSYLQIEMEKIYSQFFIASKKRYVGYDEMSKKTQFVGMEAIRGDWTDLARSFQVNLVNLIFKDAKKEEISKFILTEIDMLKSGKKDELLIYKKKITKPLHEYTKMTPPHVKAAREIKDFSGRVVKYVMTSQGPKHISLIRDKVEYDYNHYIEKQLKGVADDLLESLGIDFDEVLNNKKQKSLDRFFG